MKKKIAMLLTATMVMGLALTGCGGSKTEEESASSTASSEKSIVYAVEAGSAGEMAAEDNGLEYKSVESQADAMMEVDAGTSEGAIVDLLMAAAMTGEDSSYPNLKYEDADLSSEEFGIGCRKDSDLVSFMNQSLYEAYSDGTMAELAEKYNMSDAVMEMEEAAYEASESDSDVEAIKAAGKIVVGITDYPPMDYKGDNGDEWIGFDAELAQYVADKLGVEVEFMEINWDNKLMELNAGNIDCVWNGMTLTNEVTSSMGCSNPYCANKQVYVVPAE